MTDSAGLKLVLAEDLGQLVPEVAGFISASQADVLQPFSVVVPSMGLRQWLDQELSRQDQAGTGGVAANLTAVFPRDLVVQVEQLVLRDEWVDWGVGTTALRILGAQQLDSYDEALRRAEAIDEIVRYRPELFDHLELLPSNLKEAVERLSLIENGPQVQRRRVLEALRTGTVEGLPEELAIFGVTDAPGGPRFLELLHAVSQRCDVRVYMPVPSVARAQQLLASVGSSNRDDPGFSWSRDSTESLLLWAATPHELEVLPPPASGLATTLASLKASLRGVDASGVEDDRSVELLGSFGDDRQVEQLRDAIFEQIEGGVQPWEILVVSPRPGDFEASLERHWAYRTWEGGDELDAPRLPHELLEVSPEELRNRLGASLALLRLVGNYATQEQVVDLLLYPSVSTGLGLGFEAARTVALRAREGKLIFGVSPEQRQAFDVYPLTDEVGVPLDIGTWQRVSDAVAASTLYPPARIEPVAAPIRPVGVPEDLELFGRLQPLLRVLDGGRDLRDPTTPDRPLSAWLHLLSGWMEAVSGQGGEDDSFSTQVLRLRRELDRDDQLGRVTMPFTSFIEMWASLAQARRFSRIFGKGGVVVSGLESLTWVPYKVVCILGLDAERLPGAGLPGAGLAPSGVASRPGDPSPRRSALGKLLATVLAAQEKLIISFNVRDEGSGQRVEPAIALSEFLDHLSASIGIEVKVLVDRQAESARRHNFGGDHLRPRYDQRLVRLRERGAESSSRAGDHDTSDNSVSEVTIGELQAFLRNPVGYHLRHSENLQPPREIEGSPIRPSVSVGNLDEHAFREAYLEYLLDMPEWDELLTEEMDSDGRTPLLERFSEAATPGFLKLLGSEEFSGDVPAMLWLPNDLKVQIELLALNYRFDLADFEQVRDPDDALLRPIELGGGRRLLLVSPHAEARGRFSPLRGSQQGVPLVTTHHLRSSHHTDAEEDIQHMATKLVELLALRVNSGKTEARVRTWSTVKKLHARSGGSSGMIPRNDENLNPLLELRADAKELSSENARGQLASIFDLYVEGLSKPIDYFKYTSAPLAFPGGVRDPSGTSRSSWGGRPGSGFSEQRLVINELLYPYDYRELLERTRFIECAARVGVLAHGVQFRDLTETQSLPSQALLARAPEVEKRYEIGLTKTEDAHRWEPLDNPNGRGR